MAMQQRAEHRRDPSEILGSSPPYRLSAQSFKPIRQGLPNPVTPVVFLPSAGYSAHCRRGIAALVFGLP